MVDAIQELELIRENELLRLLKISHSTIWRRRRARKFPEPIKLTDRSVAWRLADIRAWLAERVGQ